MIGENSAMPDHAVNPPTPSLATLERGRQVYVTSCTGCHRLYGTRELDRAGWNEAVRTMAPKAKLAPTQRDDVLAYLLAASR